MTTLLWIAIKATLLLGAGWVTVTAMRKAAAATRHRVCMLALGGACLLPLFELAGPRWEAAPASALITAVVAGTATSSASAISLLRTVLWILPWIWAAGALLALARALGGVAWIAAASRRATGAGDPAWTSELAALASAEGLSDRPIALRIAPVGTPLVWGLRRPVILLPESALQWPSDQRRMVLLHELAHVGRRDALALAVSQAACVLYWFHPLAWMLAARLIREQEMACDDQVLSSGVGAADYAGFLLESARALPSPALVCCAMFSTRGSRSMRERFAHLLDAGRVRATRPLCLAVVAPLFALMLAVLGGFSPAAGDDQPYKVGGDVEAPRVIYKTEPAYTPEAREAKIEGRVRLTCIVRTDGTADTITVALSLDPGLDQQAVDSLRSWRFDPATRKGEPVDVSATVEFDFRLW